MDRRDFLTAASAATVAAAPLVLHAADDKPALLGGQPVHVGKWPAWPVFNQKEEQALLETLHTRQWYRGSSKMVDRFEEAYAKLTGAKYCLGTANGTSALLTSLMALGIQGGDEVILPPYTFVATVNVILMLSALPVFVDTDRETSQIDARKIEAAITPRTKIIMPVHLGGSVADLDAILAISRKHGIPVVEDTCQSHLAEWRGKKAGTYGATGCFSFQASKNLNSGEGGAILSNDENLIEKCYATHNNSRGRKTSGYNFEYACRGANLRMHPFEAAMLLSQMTRLEEQSKTRGQNAQYLSSLLKEIPGITPAKMYDGCTRNAYHLYMYRYDPAKFAGLPLRTFSKAMHAEGVPCGPGYSPLNKEPYIKKTVQSRAYRALFPADIVEGWEERTRCPENDQLCQEAVWMTQTMLLAKREDMDKVAEAIRKVQKHAAALARA